VAAVTVDWVPAGVDPSELRGSEMTSVEAILLLLLLTVDENDPLFHKVLAPFAARDRFMVISVGGYCDFKSSTVK
jgi:hypothetical protein